MFRCRVICKHARFLARNRACSIAAKLCGHAVLCCYGVCRGVSEKVTNASRVLSQPSRRKNQGRGDKRHIWNQTMAQRRRICCFSATVILKAVNMTGAGIAELCTSHTAYLEPEIALSYSPHVYALVFFVHRSSNSPRLYYVEESIG